MSCAKNIGDFVKTREELSVDLRIHDIFSFPGKDVYFKSPDFQFCGACWSLTVWPNEDQVEEDLYSGRVDLDLCRNDSGPPVTVHVTFGIRGSAGVEWKTGEQRSFLDDICRYDDFLSRSELKNHASRLMPNNILTVTCELKTESPSCARGVEKLQKSLRSMLMSGEDSDVVFKVQDKVFPAHRIILKARSPVFRAMFTHDMVEKWSGVVAVDDCDPQAFSDFLDHVYTGSSEKINLENVSNIYMVSDKYEMDTLKEQCVACIKKNLSVASFCSIMAFALKYNDEALIEFATQFFCINSSEIVTESDWQAFYEENSAAGYKLLIKALTE